MSQVSFTIGDVRITRLEENYGPAFPLAMLLPSYDAGALEPDAIAGFVAGDMALASVHSWLVQTPQKTILIDTCTGNHKSRPSMEGMHMLDLPWLAQLDEAGVAPTDVDAVVCTHLHLDHVGWNTQLVDGEWVPTFPNATHYFNRVEYDFWGDNRDTEALAFNANVFDDSVAPIFDRGLAELWEGDGLTVDDTLRLELAAGHTPGTASAGSSRAASAACSPATPCTARSSASARLEQRFLRRRRRRHRRPAAPARRDGRARCSADAGPLLRTARLPVGAAGDGLVPVGIDV